MKMVSRGLHIVKDCILYPYLEKKAVKGVVPLTFFGLCMLTSHKHKHLFRTEDME